MTDEEWKKIVYDNRADELRKYHPAWYEELLEINFFRHLWFSWLTAGSMSPGETEAGAYPRSASLSAEHSRGEEPAGSQAGRITPHHDVALGMIQRFYERIGSAEVRRVWLFSPDHFSRARASRRPVPRRLADTERILEADREASQGSRVPVRGRERRIACG